MKKLIQLTLILTLALGLIACSTEASPAENNTNNAKTNNSLNKEANKADNSETKENETVENTDPESESKESLEEKEYKVTLNFPTREYVVDGNEENKMGTEEVEIYANSDNLAEKIVRKLEEGPKSEDLLNGIPKNIKILTVELKDGIAFVNFSDENLNSGSLDEETTINQIVKSLVSVENIKGVKFLINGNDAKTLMGHYDVSEVLTDGV